MTTPEYTIHVLFDKDGREYTYRRTLEAFAREMVDRAQVRGMPFRMWYVDQEGDETDIKIRVT